MPVRAGCLPLARGFSGPAPNSKTPRCLPDSRRAFVRRQDFFPFQAPGFRFERRNVLRVIQRDELKKFVVRRASVRRRKLVRASRRAAGAKFRIGNVVPPRRPVLPPPDAAAR